MNDALPSLLAALVFGVYAATAIWASVRHHKAGDYASSSAGWMVGGLMAVFTWVMLCTALGALIGAAAAVIGVAPFLLGGLATIIWPGKDHYPGMWLD